MEHYINQGDDFDIQRDPSAHIFYKPMTPGANYIVGVFSGAFGLDVVSTNLGSSFFAIMNDKDPWYVIQADQPYWMLGNEDYWHHFNK